MHLQYDPHSSTLYDATTGAAVAVLYDDLPAAERHALGRLFAAAEGMRDAQRIALHDALDACDKQTAPKGSGEFGRGWIVARENCMTAIRALLAEPPA